MSGQVSPAPRPPRWTAATAGVGWPWLGPVLAPAGLCCGLLGPCACRCSASQGQATGSNRQRIMRYDELTNPPSG